MRVQFSVSASEWAKLQSLATANGYPDVSTYCKDTSLQERTYSNMWKIITDKISKMQRGEIFALRDLVQSPPANLGVKLYENQKKLGIQVNAKKNSLKVNTFTKL